MLSSLIIVLSFVSIIPIPSRYIPEWNKDTLRYFCPMLAAAGVVFGALWLFARALFAVCAGMSFILQGFLMAVITLAFTGGLHLDGLMDTCDAVFSRRDRETRLAILSDTHAGSFAVMGCVIVLLAKTLLFAEVFRRAEFYTFAGKMDLFCVPVYSRLGMAVLMNNLPFARTGGLAVMLGSSRSRKDNVFFAVMMIALCVLCSRAVSLAFGVSIALWAVMCVRVFGGITGDLLGGFVEFSEVVMLMSICA